jgi:hypothetical protein
MAVSDSSMHTSYCREVEEVEDFTPIDKLQSLGVAAGQSDWLSA